MSPGYDELGPVTNNTNILGPLCNGQANVAVKPLLSLTCDWSLRSGVCQSIDLCARNESRIIIELPKSPKVHRMCWSMSVFNGLAVTGGQNTRWPTHFANRMNRANDEWAWFAKWTADCILVPNFELDLLRSFQPFRVKHGFLTLTQTEFAWAIWILGTVVHK